MIRHRRCHTRSASYTSGSGYVPPKCVMCGKPVTPGQSSISFYAPDYPEANKHGRVWRHAQDVTGGPLVYREGRKWSRGVRS